MTDLAGILRQSLAEIEGAANALDPAPFAALEDTLLEAGGTFVAGRGRSGLVMRGFAMRLMHLGLKAHVAGEATTPPIAESDLLVIGSGSGRTATLLPLAERARDAGARVALITIDAQAPLARSADPVAVIPGASPKLAGADTLASAQPMGSLFEQTLGLALDALVMRLMARLGEDSAAMFARHANLE